MMPNEELGNTIAETFFIVDFLVSKRLLTSITTLYKELDWIVENGDEADCKEDVMDNIDALELAYTFFSGDENYQSRLEEYESYEEEIDND